MKDTFDLAREKTERFIDKEKIPHHMFELVPLLLTAG